MTAAASPRVAPPRAPGARPHRWERLRTQRPEWWLRVAAGAGWLVLAAAVLGRPGAGHGGHAGALDGGGPHALAWAAMIAVMAPLIAANVHYAAMRSPRRARAAVTGDVVLGWTLVWAGAATVLGLGAWALTSTVGEPAAVGLLTVAAVAWQHSSPKRRSLARCRAVLAPPLDRRRSRRACRRYGVRLGRDCVLGCAPLMALMAVAAHDPLVVAASTGVIWYERRCRPHHDPAPRGTSTVIALAGAAALAAHLAVL